MGALGIFAPFLPLLLTIFTAMVTMYRAWPRGDFLKAAVRGDRITCSGGRP
jgi:hypothetical protein